MLRTTIVAIALLSACGSPDSDGDGLSNAVEAAIGTNPDNPDTDGDGLWDGAEIPAGTDPLASDTDDDGLSDGDEVLLGTDPLEQDSDSDSYRDGDEVQQGTDPLDAGDVIYRGLWPFNPNKDGVEAPTEPYAKVGSRVPRLQLPDQYGDQVDLYDFIGQNEPIVLAQVFSDNAMSQALGEWLSGHPTETWTTDYGAQPWFTALPERIRKGEARWITVVAGVDWEIAATEADAQAWASAYPLSGGPVLADVDREYRDYRNGGRMTVVELTDNDLVVWDVRDDIGESMQALYDRLDP